MLRKAFRRDGEACRGRGRRRGLARVADAGIHYMFTSVLQKSGLKDTNREEFSDSAQKVESYVRCVYRRGDAVQAFEHCLAWKKSRQDEDSVVKSIIGPVRGELT
ncbi:uncharacterized protein LOC144587873 isoform X1 [Pogona vitticeps]